MSINDNEPAETAKPTPVEAHGQAALILIESLIHGLVSRSVLTLADTLDIVDTAVEVQADYIAEAEGTTHERAVSQSLLTRIATSLRLDIDLPGDPSARGAKLTLAGVKDRPPENS